MIEYFNGNSHLSVNSIDKLTDLSQDEVNFLACGPQDLFFEKLETMNRELERFGLKSIDVTNKWNWKPGSYDVIKDYMLKKLQLNKKAMSIDKIMTRARDRMNYMNFIQRQATEMEFEKANLKRLGVGRDVDVDKFIETSKKFVEDTIKQCQAVSTMTENKVTIVPYVDISNGRNAILYYDVTLKDLTLSIFDGREEVKLIQEIPLQNIHIIFNTSLRHKINNLNTSFSVTGIYDTEGPNLAYVYIARGYRDTNNYNTVCLDKHYDDVKKAFNKNNLMMLAVTLMNWAQYYNIKISNPYNQPYMSHIGMPEHFSKEYKAAIDTSSVQLNCSAKLKKYANSLELFEFERDELLESVCNNHKCSVKSTCSLNQDIVKRQIIFKDEDFMVRLEGLIGWIAEWIKLSYLGENGDREAGSFAVEGWLGFTPASNWGLNDEQWTDRLMQKALWYYASVGETQFNGYTYSFLEDNHLLDREPIKVKVDNETTDEEKANAIKLQMMRWASESRG